MSSAVITKDNSLKFYQGTGYGVINRFLREYDISDEKINDKSIHKHEYVLEHIYNIKQSIDEYGKRHMKEYKDIEVYRGTTFNIQSLINGAGNAFIEKGFCSVSTNINIALNFTGETCCILTFVLPEIYAYKFDYKGNYREDEYLLERNLEFYDIQYSHTYNKKKVYTCKVRRHIPSIEENNKKQHINDYMEEQRRKMIYDDDDFDFFA